MDVRAKQVLYYHRSYLPQICVRLVSPHIISAVGRIGASHKQRMRNFELEQKEMCRRFDVVYEPLDTNLKLGISDNFFFGVLPLNGLRHPQKSDTCGWYLWAGEELSDADDFFKPLHVYHLLERSPEVVKYLALPEGWRFLVAREYEDVWFDAKLFEV